MAKDMMSDFREHNADGAVIDSASRFRCLVVGAMRAEEGQCPAQQKSTRRSSEHLNRRNGVV